MSARRFLLLFVLLAGVRFAVVPIALSSDATAPSKYRILPGDARDAHTGEEDEEEQEAPGGHGCHLTDRG